MAAKPDDPESEYIMALALAEDDRSEAAEPIARKLAELRPNDAANLLLLGMVQFNQGDVAGARQSLEHCLAVDPQMTDAHYYLAVLAQREGKVDIARGELESVVQANPNHAAAQSALGILYLQMGETEKARTALEQATKLAPEVSQNHYQLGLAYTRLGLADRARAEMEQYQKLREIEDNQRKHRTPATGAVSPAPQGQL